MDIRWAASSHFPSGESQDHPPRPGFSVRTIKPPRFYKTKAPQDTRKPVALGPILLFPHVGADLIARRVNPHVNSHVGPIEFNFRVKSLSLIFKLYRPDARIKRIRRDRERESERDASERGASDSQDIDEG